MDFVRLVEKGTYSKENLSPLQKEFIRGMELSLQLLDFVLEEAGDSLVEQLLSEIQEDTIEQVKRYIYSSICENIVFFEDGNFEKEESLEL